MKTSAISNLEKSADPALFTGLKKSKIVLTARSGRAALAYRAKDLGYNLCKNELDVIYKEFILMADRYKEVGEKELKTLLSKTFVTSI